MKLLSRNCPVCACQEGECLTTISLAPVQNEALPLTFDVCVCKKCKSCFDDLQANQDDFDRFYAASNKYAAPETGGSGGWSNADTNRWNHVIDILSSHIHTTDRIIDIGCGKGGLLMALQARGFQNLVGIEPSLGCRQNLAAQNILCHSTMEDAIRQGETFDCVLCCQVLEHVFALDAFLADIGKLSTPESILYIEVPDAAGYLPCPVLLFRPRTHQPFHARFSRQPCLSKISLSSHLWGAWLGIPCSREKNSRSLGCLPTIGPMRKNARP